jgi:hypothetical protein
MKLAARACFIVPAVALALFSPAVLSAQYFAIQSFSGSYLQAHQDNGETHASNKHRGDEETWIIVWSDNTKTTVAIQNVSNGHWLAMRGGDCTPAKDTELGPWQKWKIEDAGNGWVHIHSARTDYDRYLAANQPGKNTSCGGEVASNLKADSTLWKISTRTTPSEPGGGPDIIGILETAAKVLGAVVTVAGAVAP